MTQDAVNAVHQCSALYSDSAETLTLGELRRFCQHVSDAPDDSAITVESGDYPGIGKRIKISTVFRLW